MDNKIHATITINANVLKAHRACGNNVSKLCNDFLTDYFLSEGEKAIKEAQNKVDTIKETVSKEQKTATNTQNTLKILNEAKQNRAKGKEFHGLITLAQYYSGKNRAELVKIMEEN